jgi:cytidylate kinase
MVVAIDGPAGCGKSTIARMVSERLDFSYINSGNIYRAISLASIRKGLRLDDPEGIVRCAQKLDIGFDPDGTLLLDGARTTTELRSEGVDAIVAQVSAIVAVRDVVNSIVRKAAKGRNIVVEGRDMTTVVFPDAEVKFYLDASVEERARRRFEEKSTSRPMAQILDNIRMRDSIDTTKAVGALKIAPDALYLDTSGLTIDQVYEKVNNQILHSREAHGE